MLATIDRRPSEFPVIGVDLDDIIADYTTSSLNVIHRTLGPNPDVCREKHFDYFVDVSFGKEAGTAVEEAMKNPGFWLEIPPMPGAVKSLIDLMQHYSIHIITHRPEQFRDITQFWLVMYEIPFDVLTLVDERIAKVDAVKQAKCVAFVDDNQDTIETLREEGLIVGQLAWPWNKGGPGIIRKTSWADLSLSLAHELKLKDSDQRLF